MLLAYISEDHSFTCCFRGELAYLLHDFMLTDYCHIVQPLLRRRICRMTYAIVGLDPAPYRVSEPL